MLIACVRRAISILLALVFLPIPARAACELASRSVNALSAAERVAGWRLLFDGESFVGWKNFGAGDSEISGWVIEAGALRMTRDVSRVGLAWNAIKPFGRPSVDLMTRETFENFELCVDWKLSPGGNSGIFYLQPDGDPAWGKRGLEMQVLDDAGHPDGQMERHRNGDLYDLIASTSQPVRPVGEWNTARIVVTGDHVEHWLNGVAIVVFERAGPEWQALVARSKFAGRADFGAARRGHILLQDHGDPIWYRNLKLRELP